MPGDKALSPQDRLKLVQTLSALPDAQFQMLQFSLDLPSGILPADTAALGLRAVALLDWAEKSGPGLTALLETMAILTGKPLVAQITKLVAKDCEELFGCFSSYDFAAMQSAFLGAFQDVHEKGFWQVRPDNPPLNEPEQIQELITTFDDPVLAVRFVERSIAAFKSSNDGMPRDITPFEQWRDRLIAQFNIPPRVLPVEPPDTRHGYLLVTLDPLGPDINVYAELRVTGRDKPIRFGARPKTCSIDQVSTQISEWINQAEDALTADLCDDEEVTLEVFLPCQYLEEDIGHTWNVLNKRGDEVALGIHRRFVVRSFERIRDNKMRRSLQRRWKTLEACVQAKNAGAQFHLQAECPDQKGILCALLKDGEAPGLKFVAALPQDAQKRADLLNEFVDAPVPIVLWSAAETALDTDTLKAEFDALLSACYLTNFTDVAKQWRRRRLTAATAARAKPIRILCDRPDRWPNLPNAAQAPLISP